MDASLKLVIFSFLLINTFQYECAQIEWNDMDEYICTPTTVEILTTAPVTRPWIIDGFECSDNKFIGQWCNVSNDPCQMAQVCQNQGQCIVNNTHALGYFCRCPLQYSGDLCENDDRICKNNTCWHDGQCVEVNNPISVINETTFQCHCTPGYDGINCQFVSNTCEDENIHCQNGGRCISSHLSWSCQCLGDSLYSGELCQDKSSELVAKQILSKSFASIAITAITVVFIFVFTMDILKHVFKIDPIDRERKLMELDRARQKKKVGNKKSPKSTKESDNIRLYVIST